ncbi:MAG: SpoIIE family protein phosphatase [Bacteroidales bacterium]|nr:SpoIIE family protein phosphatase [Bacteroidales bacterium]
MKKLIIFIIAISCFTVVFSQNQSEIDSLNKLLTNTKEDTVKYKILLELSDKLKYINVDSAINSAELAIGIAKKNNLLIKEYEANNILAVIYRNQSKNKKARKLFLYNLNIANKLSDSTSIASAYGNIANTYIYYNKFDSAIYYYSNALEIFEKIQHTKGIAILNATLGNLYLKMEEYDKALHSYLIACKLFKDINFEYYLAISSMNIGIVYQNKNNLDSALIYFNIAKTKFEDMKKFLLLGQCIGNIGKAHSYKKNYLKSINYFEKAEKFLLKFNALRDLAIIYYETGVAYDSLNQNSKAIDYYNKALNIAKDEEYLKNCVEEYKALSDIYKKTNNFKSSLKYFELFKIYSDSLIVIENTKNTDKLLIEFETKQKENEIKILKKDKLLNKEKIRRQNIVILSISFVIVFSILLIIIIYKNYKRKKHDNELLVHQNTEINHQKEEIETQANYLQQANINIMQQKQEITDSINYASRIQTAVLPSKKQIEEILPEHFILFKPRNIVSGDFYWTRKVNKYIIIAVADCTGHGVPGAFMSMLGISFLNDIVRKQKITQANQVLEELRNQIKTTLDQTGKEDEAKDGMDIALCIIDTETNKLQYAGAYNPLYIIHNNQGVEDTEIIQLSPNNQPIGTFPKEQPFNNKMIQLNKKDTLYMFSDGYIDQFGCDNKGKFQSKNFKKLLLDIHDKPMIEQKQFLEETFNKWKGNIEQIDDVLVMGIRI